ncbi:TetR/AcrR family transcriptional regulator [Streptomyces mirabilis]|uniref:TetR/AcrR family transcriptional regulator n=1 Tax=Streptomyces mirabilis TaxID=68239 RepID=UPI0036528222
MAAVARSVAPVKTGDAPRSGRSRMTPEREAELYSAVLDLLRKFGYEALTMEAIAARSRCSKATLYRRWAGKPELVATALRHQRPVALGEIDTGSLRGDFQAIVAHMDERHMEQDTALLRALSSAVHAYPDLLQALRGLLIDPELTGLEAVLARAVERGEIASGAAALAYVPHMLVGVLVAQPLLMGRPLDATFARRYVDAAVLPALGI